MGNWSYVGSIASAAAAQAYVATAIRLPGGPPLAYWRLASPDSLLDEMAARNGSWTITGGSLVSGLPQGSDGAVDFKGVAAAQVPHDPGFALPAFTLSFWFRLNTLPDDGKVAILVSKDQSGNIAGDFFIYVTQEGALSVYFQTGTAQPNVSAPIEVGQNYHMCVRADSSGFDAFLDGQYLGKNTSHTSAWSLNTQPIRFVTTPWTADLGDVVLDEVALYARVLTESEVLALAQGTEAPSATSDSFVVPESATTVLDVTANDTFAGQKANLTVEVVSQGSHGTATVRSDKDIAFAAGAVAQDEDDSFTYRITDANGTSNTATVNVTVQNSASVGGGALVYDWSPQLAWMSGSLASRSGSNILTASKWDETAGTGASVGGTLFKSTVRNGTVGAAWNRAPTGHPSLEIWSPANQASGSRIDLCVQLYDHLGTGSGPWPRHLRAVAEMRLCHSGDPTTFKADGQGTTTGSYTNWTATHVNTDGTNQGGKFYLGLYAGTQGDGGCRTNWWGNSTYPINKAGFRVNWATSSKSIGPYTYAFGRPGGCGLFTGGSAKATDSGVVGGCWFRLEIEVFLTTPSTVPNNARRSEPETSPSQTGDGFVRVYLAKDIDGELGTPGTRQLIAEQTGLLFFPKSDDVGSDDNMHSLANLGGFWLNLYYGGSGGNFGQSWAWIRRIQVYNHD